MAQNRSFRRMLVVCVYALMITACGAPPAGEGDRAAASPTATFSPTAARSPASTGMQNSEIGFPQQMGALGSQMYPVTMVKGTLVLVDDCLRVVPSYDSSTSYAPLWPPDVTLHTDVDPIEVRIPDGRVMARVGDPIVLVGGDIGTGAGTEVIKHVRRPIPANCPGPYWYAAPSSDQPIAPAAPAATQPVPSGFDPDDPYVQDAQYYAATHGIPLEKALQQLHLQEPISVLSTELEAKESATFAGLWIQDEPQYHVVVAFTRDGEQTIKPYVAGGPLENVIEVRPARYTVAELKAAQDDITRQLASANMSFSSGINVEKNWIEVHAPDMDQFNAALRKANITLPPMVGLVEQGPLPMPLPSTLPDPDATATPLPSGVNVFFPQIKPQLSPGLPDTALIEGTLINDNGCLRVQTSSGESYLLIWPPEVTLYATPELIEVHDKEGKAIARVGEQVLFGGSGFEANDQAKIARYNEQFREPLPQQCAGPYWAAGLNVQ